MILSYSQRYFFKSSKRFANNLSIFELHGSLYTLKMVHLLFLIVISDKIIALNKLILFTKDLLLRPFSIYSIKPIRFESVLSSF